MPELNFRVSRAEAAKDTAGPVVILQLDITNRPATDLIHAILLRCQIQIEVPRRRHSAVEQENLLDLFGTPDRWSQTLRALQWACVSTTVPCFSGSTAVGLAVPCTFDLGVASSKYFHGLEDGTVPITVLLSGTVFYRTAADQLQAAPIPWTAGARFDFPVAAWKHSMDLHYPNTAWLSLRRDLLERLYQFKVRHGLATFEEALDRLMTAAEEVGV